MSNGIRIVPLGGLGEIGKNIMVIESKDDMILIDCGLTFPREEGMFGVDIVLPDFEYVRANVDKLRAVVLTHGHEDHIGSLPFLMRQVDVPEVWGTRFTLGLVKSRADEHGLIGATDWKEIVPEKGAVKIGPFELEFVRVAHSIPDCVSVLVRTSEGTILHTGDLKIDPSPMDGVQTDLAKFAELGSAGVDVYLADSTNADVPGHTKSELSIAGPLRDIVHRAPGRVIVSCFSSHIHRMQQLIDIAQETGRVVCLLGRSMNRNVNIARNLGFMDVEGATLVKPQRLEEFNHSDVMILCTGSQGEPLAALQRIASGVHPRVEPDPMDTVIFSSRTIPGNENRVHGLFNKLSKVGCHIVHADIASVHVSGHGSSEELKTLLQLVRPRTFVPVHGEWRHLRAHSELAEMVGVQPQSIMRIENGDVIELTAGKARLTGETVPVGHTLMDRHAGEDIVDEIMDERKQASGDGLLVIVARIDEHRHMYMDVVSRGFIDADDELLHEARETAEESIANMLQTRAGEGELEDAMRDAVSSVVYDRTRRSPLVVPVLIED
jgi:ribonuclease J